MESFWSQPLRVEFTEHAQLITSRSINSQLWFVNNKTLQYRILAYLAKYKAKYGVLLYAFVLVGNHYHLLARFPKGQRSEFFRDFNARIAEAVRHLVPQFIGGPLFEKRFTPQILPLDLDLENYFFYCALQPVSSGLTQRISDYEQYNSFSDAISQREQVFKVFKYGKYNAAKRTNPYVNRDDFMEEYTLSYEKLPHLIELSSADYQKSLLTKLEQRRVEIVKDRLVREKGFLGKENLRRVVPGSLPRNTKKGGIRPLVLSCCRETKQSILSWYFGVVTAYRKAVEKYRRGEFHTEFPPGTFRPNGMCICGP